MSLFSCSSSYSFFSSFHRKFTFVWNWNFSLLFLAWDRTRGALSERRRLENYKNNVWRSLGMSRTLFVTRPRFCGELVESWNYRILRIMSRKFLFFFFFSFVWAFARWLSRFYGCWLSLSWNLLKNNWIWSPHRAGFWVQVCSNRVRERRRYRCSTLVKASEVTQNF